LKPLRSRSPGIPFIAGAADRGDFDATSTTMALNPAQAALPAAMLQATFDRYWQESERPQPKANRAWQRLHALRIAHRGRTSPGWTSS
jgi:hypothetical protein